MIKPLVSVVMPVYNCASFLSAAIDSILNQNFEDFEFIIINDGSTDASDNIINSYSDSRIRYFVQENAGVAKALNKGIGMAEGKYLYRHDADDVSLPGKLQEQVNFLESNPAYVLCATQIAFMTESGKIAYKYKQPKEPYFGVSPYVEVKREHFNPYSPITHATVLVRRDVILDLGCFRTEFLTAEDVDLWLRLLQHHKAAVLNSCNYYVRLNKASATSKHGWKNAFFRNLAFEYYRQREVDGKDDLQKGKIITVPAPPRESDNAATHKQVGSVFRSDLLPFMYALHLNAKDWDATATIVKNAINDGWKLKQTWKSLLFPLLGHQTLTSLVSIKKKLYGR